MTNSHIRSTGGRNSERNNGSPQPPSSAITNSGGYNGSHRKNSRGHQKSPSSAIFFQRNHSISPTLAKNGSSSPSKLGRSDNIHTTPNGSHVGQQQQHNQHYSQRQTPPMAIASYHQQTNHYQQPYHQQFNQHTNSHFNANHHNHRASPGSHYSGSSSTSSSPPNITLYAGSKCYDAPAPTALPRPPIHWTSCSMAFSGTLSNGDSDNEFSQNLKMMLNVSA